MTPGTDYYILLFQGPDARLKVSIPDLARTPFFNLLFHRDHCLGGAVFAKKTMSCRESVARRRSTSYRRVSYTLQVSRATDSVTQDPLDDLTLL